MLFLRSVSLHVWWCGVIRRQGFFSLHFFLFSMFDAVSVQTGSFLVTIFCFSHCYPPAIFQQSAISPPQYTHTLCNSHTQPHDMKEKYGSFASEVNVLHNIFPAFKAVYFHFKLFSLFICFIILLDVAMAWRPRTISSPWLASSRMRTGSIEMENNGKKNPTIECDKTMHMKSKALRLCLWMDVCVDCFLRNQIYRKSQVLIMQAAGG